MQYTNTFRKSFVLAVLLTLFTNVFSQNLTIKSESRSALSLQLTIDKYDINEIHDGNEIMHEVALNSIALPNEQGKPNLPYINRFVAIPQGSNAKIVVNNYKKEIIKDINIAPSQGIDSESDTTRTYIKDLSIYSKNELYPANIVSLSENMKLRGIDAVALNITPVQYNPISKELVIYTEINMSIEFEGECKNFGDDRLRSAYWDPILQHNILNYNSLPKIDYAERMQTWISEDAEGAEYLIITPDNEAMKGQAQRLADYRSKQGIISKVYSLKDINKHTPDDIRNWFIDAYNNWEIAPVAVCLLGDYDEAYTTSGIPNFIFNFDSYQTYISDRPYSDVDNDLIPDMAFSRLSAENAQEAKNMIDKQIDYEFNSPVMDESFYQSPIMTYSYQMIKWFQITAESLIGHLESKGKDPYRMNLILDFDNTFDDEVWSSAQNTSQVLNYFGPNGLGYIPGYPREVGEYTECGQNHETVILNKISNEPGYILLNRGHGWFTIWSCPPLNSTNLDNLTNYKKYPFLLSINCGTGAFDRDNCLAENFMKYANIGAIGVIAATYESHTYTNDSYLWGVWDFFENDFLPDYGNSVANNNNYMPAFADASAKHFINQQKFPNTTENTISLTSNLFHSFSDAFLKLYSEVPQEMNIEHDETYLIGSNTFKIKAPVGSMIALSIENDGKIKTLAIAEGTGNMQNINISGNIDLESKMMVTVTKTNHLRYEENIIIITDQAYVTIDDFNFYENSHELTSNQDTYLDLTLKNIGVKDASTINLSLSCDSDAITITENNVVVDGVNTNETVTIEDAFFIDLTDGIANGTSIKFTLDIEHDELSYKKDFNVIVTSYNFEITEIDAEEFDGDGNNFIDPGEIAKFTLTIENTGSYKMENVTANLISNDNFVRVISKDVAVENLNIADDTDIEFEVYIEWHILPKPISLTLELDIDGYKIQKDFEKLLGTLSENFENGTMENESWKNDSFSPWYVVDDEGYLSNYSLRSGPIGDDSSTEISITVETTADKDISFYYKTSIEDSWDIFYFYIDGECKLEATGEKKWTYAHFPVSEGTHTYTWKYQKDMMLEAGWDCVWIDDIIFPCSSFTNIEEIENENIRIYPNPANDFINIGINDNHNGNFNISIYNSLGIKVFETSNKNTINIEDLPSGMYFINVTTEDLNKTKKIIIN